MEDKVIFFDGVCGLCDHFVNFLLKIDKKEKLKFASLQGSYAKAHLENGLTDNPHSVVFLTDQKIYIKSKALIHIFYAIGGPWKSVGLFINLFPLFISNFIYDKVAKNRFLFFNKRESCRMPKSHELHRFL